MPLAKYNDAHRRAIASPFVFVAKRMLQENVAAECCQKMLQMLKENTDRLQPSQSSIDGERACHRRVNNLSESG
jgi:hypothetical protein